VLGIFGFSRIARAKDGKGNYFALCINGIHKDKYFHIAIL